MEKEKEANRQELNRGQQNDEHVRPAPSPLNWTVNGTQASCSLQQRRRPSGCAKEPQNFHDLAHPW